MFLDEWGMFVVRGGGGGGRAYGEELSDDFIVAERPDYCGKKKAVAVDWRDD